MFELEHSVTSEKKPWTHLDFDGRCSCGDTFTFGIVSDRSGRPTPGVFEKAIETMNRMNPEFVISVGDFVEGFCNEDFSGEFIRKQWDKINPEINKCKVPFFYTVGNHDYNCELPSAPVWKELFGVTYYFFVYKNTLFLSLNSDECADGLGKEQVKWATDVLKQHSSCRWIFIFMHNPAIWHSEDFNVLEEVLYDRNYTVFAGHYHRYTKYVRNGRKYFMLGTTGGGDVRVSQGQRGVPFGEFDHITWVSMAGDHPEFTNIALDGIHDENVVTTEKITWLTPTYFRANKKISPEEAEKLRRQGIFIEETLF